MSNIDPKTVAGFGDEWKRFDQSALPEAESAELFDAYFAVFPWESLPPDARGFDLGCGTGRWAKHVAPRVAHLHCIDPSAAIEVARQNLAAFDNVSFEQTDTEGMSLGEKTMDFGYSLGVLHHIPDTARAMRQCVRRLKIGAPFLVYLYYRFDGRGVGFRTLWRASDLARQGISRLPNWARYLASQAIAGSIYWPLARAAAVGEKVGLSTGSWPLGFYRNRSFYTMRTDALDRFGTRLERRFTKAEIAAMMAECGLRNIEFSDKAPYWCTVGIRGK